MRYIELASILTIFGGLVRAQISAPVNLDDVIKKYQLQLSDYPEAPPIDSNVECTDDHAGWAGDCAMIDDDWIINTDVAGPDKQGRPIICHGICCVIAHHKSGSSDLKINEMAMWGNNANIECNGPNEQTWVRGTEENYVSKSGGTFKMCMINHNSGNKC